MKMRSVVPMRIAKTGYVIMSVIFCIAGIFFIVRPEASMKIVGVCTGVTMILFGIVKLIGYFSKDLYRLAFQFDLEFGILMTVLGVIVLFDPGDLVMFICISLGIFILLDGLFKLRIAADARRFGIKRWWLISAMAVITGVFGMFLIFDSVTGSKVLTVILGLTLLSEGILNLYTVISTVLIIKDQFPDVIDADAFEIKEKER